MLSLWQMSLSASAVILLTALLRRLAGPRLPRRMYVALWDIALLSSLIPFRLPWEALARQIPDRAATITGAWTDLPLPAAALSAVTAEHAAPTAMPVTVLPAVSGIQRELAQTTQSLRETAQSAPVWLWQILGVVWGVGAIALAAVLLHRWCTCRRAFAEALPCEDQRVAAFLRAHPLRRRIRARVSNRVSSPLSYGLLRPVILLPASLSHADDQRLSYVLAHELLHIRAWDMLRKSALLLTLCLHWPNPLIWLMTRLFTRDMELMCDERVVRRLGGRKAYCLTLLDMEVQRSNLTMGTCFSVTGIEERIKVMKNRKRQNILSIALAFAIFLGAAVGAMTGIPLAGAENASPHIFFSRETWESGYAKYEPYGLGYDAKNGTITYNGQVVRYFEDMWPIDEQSKAGTCFIYEAGTVDVYGVREFSETIQRNPDGSFDPSGTLIGLREATQEEYDARTIQQQLFDTVSQETLMQTAEYDPLATAAIGRSSILYASPTPRPAYEPASPTPQPDSAATVVSVPLENIEWWTPEEYRVWIEEQRAAMEQLVSEQARAWTPSTGWFTWTQEKLEETMALYESILERMEQGVYVSKSTGSSDDALLMQSADKIVFSTAEDAASFVVSDTEALFEVGVTDEATAVNVGVLGYGSHASFGVSQEPDPASESEGVTFLLKVSPAYKLAFSPETWAMIEEQIEQGTIRWETIPARATPDDEDDQDIRLEIWSETIAPYIPFGLSCALDTVDDRVCLYWNGQEVRGLFDPHLSTWITEHTGLGYYPDDAKELIAVYENGVLTGLREADADEYAMWTKLREENTKP